MIVHSEDQWFSVCIFVCKDSHMHTHSEVHYMISFYVKGSTESFHFILTSSPIMTLCSNLERLPLLLYFKKGSLEPHILHLFFKVCRLSWLLLPEDISKGNLKNAMSDFNGGKWLEVIINRKMEFYF